MLTLTDGRFLQQPLDKHVVVLKKGPSVSTATKAAISTERKNVKKSLITAQTFVFYVGFVLGYGCICVKSYVPTVEVAPKNGVPLIVF